MLNYLQIIINHKTCSFAKSHYLSSLMKNWTPTLVLR